MLSDVTVIELRSEFFTAAETVLARHAGLTASVYRYPGEASAACASATRSGTSGRFRSRASRSGTRNSSAGG